MANRQEASSGVIHTLVDVLYSQIMFWPIATPLIIFLVLYALIFFSTEKGSYALDPQDAGSGKQKGRGVFEPHNKNYLEFAKLIIGLGSASIGALALFFFRNDTSPHVLQQRIGWPLMFFVASTIYGVAFIGVLMWRYEQYCHRPDGYTRPWYVLVLATACSMSICLLAGYSVFVWILLHL
jgi:hypothetical protein